MRVKKFFDTISNTTRYAGLAFEEDCTLLRA